MSYSRPSTSGPDFSHQPGRQLQIVVHAGPLAGKGFPITKDLITFGRDPENDISWDDSQVSRRHARLIREDEQLILEDLGSTNGTLVNGKPIEGDYILQPADIISIGTSIFGIKGFAAPSTVGVTQLSMQPPPAMPGPLPPRPAAQPRPETPSSKPRGPARPGPAPAQAGPSKLSMLAIGGILALVIIVLSLALITVYIFFQGGGIAVTQAPVVVITAPINGANVPLNLPVTVQATASDPSGVTRMELWVNGVNTAEAVSPATQGQPTLTASLQWVPAVPGSHRLEVRAYNVQAAVSQAAAVTVNVGADNGQTATPTSTPTPGTPTATVSTQPALTTLTDLNVRSGPDTTAYEVIGLLPSGTTVEIIGRDEARQWWQVRFDPAPNDIGWVASDPNFSRAVNVENIPVADAPPTPTGTPTNTPTPTSTTTPIPPTETATSTSVPPTLTPTATPTLTPTPSTSVQFTISPTVIQGGQCVAVSWNVIEVREVYYQGEGVAGMGNRTECPGRTTTYTLRVVKLDGAEQAENITVEVINPVASSGRRTLDPGETIDLDEGGTPGDDFHWRIDGADRRFEALDGVELALKGERGSLDELTLADCAGASYGAYNYIDASDVIIDPANALEDDLTACFRTDEDRLGKIRFPEYSTDDLEIEWVTWR